MAAESTSLTTLLHSLDAWGWIKGLTARGPETLFVTDTDILDALAPQLDGSGVQIATANNYQTVSMAGIKEMIFFCRLGEYAAAKKAALAYPDVLTSAATYDYLPASVIGAGFERLPSPAKAGKQKKKYNVIITAPGSGIDDLITLMQANKLGTPQLFITPALIAWASMQTDFAPLRYLSRLADYLSEHKTDLLLTTDDLAQFIETTHLTWRRAFMMAATLRLSVLYFTRRAKVTQSVELAMRRSAPGSAETSSNDKLDTFKVDSWIEYLLMLETILEINMVRLGKMKNITHEDLVGAPDNVLPDVADYFGRRMAKRPHYTVADKSDEKRDAFVAHYTRQLIDRLGLRVSKQGSFVSLSHDLLKNN